MSTTTTTTTTTTNGSRAATPSRATYRATVLTRKGDLDALELRTLPVTDPGPGELRVKVRACGAGYTDVMMRRGYYPYAPPLPFAPGYDTVGEVDAVGPGVTGFARGERVAALTVHGGYGEYLVRRAEDWVKVPAGLDDAEVAALILNYVTAYQMIHRTAKMQPGQSALVTGANGGVGAALLELLRLHGCDVVGAAQAKRHAFVREYGATPVESRGPVPLDRAVRAVRPEGVDVAFDGIGGATTGACIGAVRAGGLVVGYGFTGTMGGGFVARNAAAARGALALFVGSRLRGRRGAFYGITQIYRKDPRPFREDLPKLFELLAAGRIRPRIAARLPLTDARRANEMLEAGGIEGKIVLLAQ